MKKRVFMIFLALALSIVSVVPATMVAARDSKDKTKLVTNFNTTMTPTAIDDTVIGNNWPVRDTTATNVWPIIDMIDGAPAIIGWVIDGRSIYGQTSGDFASTFTFTYGGILDKVQSGTIEGVVTLQGDGGVLFLAATGTLVSDVMEYYSFEDLAASYGTALPTFFSIIYNNSALASLPESYLEGMYNVQLPALPKTLTANLNGDVEIETGTGIYNGVRGTGTFSTNKKEPLLLNVTPEQHVYTISGSIEMKGIYDKKSLSDKGQWGKQEKPREKPQKDKARKDFNHQ